MEKFLQKYCKFIGLIIIVPFFWSLIRETLHYSITGDDVFFLAVVKGKGVIGAALYFYTDCNGRWFSHLFTCTVFSILGTHITYYWIYLLMMTLCFTAALAFLLRSLSARYFHRLSFVSSAYSALIITACLYFFMYEGRFEVWQWMSSVSMHLLSLTFLCFGFAMLVKPGAGVSAWIITILCFAAAGGLNETYVIIALILLFIPGSKLRGAVSSTERNKVLLAFAVLLLSFSVNLFSSGISTRLGILPSFTLVQSLKNTVHTAVLPLLHYQLLPLKLMTLLVLILHCKYVSGKINRVVPLKLETALFTFSLVLFLFYINCYVLSDIVPFRSQSLGYLLITLLIMWMAMLRFKKKAPERAFKSDR
ncbi:MAG: hypothetical protein ACJ76F_00400 [Bacteroidia bacterium]